MDAEFVLAATIVFIGAVWATTLGASALARRPLVGALQLGRDNVRRSIAARLVLAVLLVTPAVGLEAVFVAIGLGLGRVPDPPAARLVAALEVVLYILWLVFLAVRLWSRRTER